MIGVCEHKLAFMNSHGSPEITFGEENFHAFSKPKYEFFKVRFLDLKQCNLVDSLRIRKWEQHKNVTFHVVCAH